MHKGITPHRSSHGHVWVRTTFGMSLGLPPCGALALHPLFPPHTCSNPAKQGIREQWLGLGRLGLRLLACTARVSKRGASAAAGPREFVPSTSQVHEVTLLFFPASAKDTVHRRLPHHHTKDQRRSTMLAAKALKYDGDVPRRAWQTLTEAEACGLSRSLPVASMGTGPSLLTKMDWSNLVGRECDAAWRISTFRVPPLALWQLPGLSSSHFPPLPYPNQAGTTLFPLPLRFCLCLLLPLLPLVPVSLSTSTSWSFSR